jgi:hypothetical protein
MTWLRRLWDRVLARYGEHFGPPLTKCWECGLLVEGVGQLVCAQCEARWRMRQTKEEEQRR